LIALWRRSHDRFWLLLAVLILVGTAVALFQRGLATDRLVSGPNGALGDVAILLLAAFFTADAVGLPRRVAIVTGIGLRSREWEFDRRFFQERVQFLESGTRLRDDPIGREGVLEFARSHLRRITALRAPNRAWAELRDGLVAADRDWIALILGTLPPDRMQDVKAAHESANAKWARLQEQYRSDSAAIRARQDPSRGESMYFAAAGLCAAVLGISTLRLLWGGPLSGGDPRFLLGIVELVAGFAVSLAAALRLWRGVRSRPRSAEGVDGRPPGA